MSALLPEVLRIELLPAAAIVLVAGCVRGFTGFGSALVMTPVLSILYDPPVAVATVVLLDLGGSLQLVPGVARLASGRELLPMAAGCLVALPAGGALLLGLEAEVMQRVIGAVVLVFVAIFAAGSRLRASPSRPAAAGVGVLSGLLLGSTSMGGPPVVLYQLAGRRTATSTRANLIVYFAMTNVAALAYFAARDVVGALVIVRACLLLPIFALGVYGGAHFFRHSGERWYRLAAFALMTAVGVAALAL